MSNRWDVGFEYLLSPVSCEEFFAEYWQPQRPLYVPADRSKFDGLIDRTSFFETLSNVPPNQSLHVKAVYTDNDGHSVEKGCIGSSEVNAHFAAGATICATGLEIANANIRAFVAALRRDIHSPDSLLMNAYYSPDQKGFGTHFDAQSVWILQIEGEKTWRYSPATVYPYPSVNAPATRAGDVLEPDGVCLVSPDENTFVEEHLRSGDVLYLPAGTWHRPIARGFSFALTLTQPHRAAYSLVSRLLRSRLLPSEEWRQHLAMIGSDIAPLKNDLQCRLDELRSIVGRLTVRDLLDVWYKQSFPELKQRHVDTPSRLAPEQTIRALSGEPILFYEDGNDSTVVYYGGSRYTLPSGSSALLRPLRDGGSMTGYDCATILNADWKNMCELLHDLIQIGIIAAS